MPAKLPEQLETLTIGSMLPGETAWTVPWAMSVDEEGDCYLNEGYTIYPESMPGGMTVQMRVERKETGEYIVDLTRCHRNDYSRGTNSGPPWYGIPVEDIKF